MSDFKNFYQKLVTIPNLVAGTKKEAEVRSALKEMMGFLDNIKTKVEAVDVSIVKHGRKQYAAEVKVRCDHLSTRTTEIYNQHLKSHVDNGDMLTTFDDPKINNLRDFYHYLYYTAFYVGRYVLVHSGEFDISTHKDIPQALSDFMKRATASASHLDLADRSSSLLSKAEKKRNQADYIFNPHVITNLAAVNSIKEDYEDLQRIVTGANQI